MYTPKKKETENTNYCSSHESFNIDIKNPTQTSLNRNGMYLFINVENLRIAGLNCLIYGIRTLCPLLCSVFQHAGCISDKPFSHDGKETAGSFGIYPTFSATCQRRKGLPQQNLK